MLLNRLQQMKFVQAIKSREDMRAVYQALSARMKFPYPERIDEVHMDDGGKTIPGIIVWNIASLVQDFPNVFILCAFVIIFGMVFPYL